MEKTENYSIIFNIISFIYDIHSFIIFWFYKIYKICIYILQIVTQKNYQRLEDGDSNCRVVISLTTTPEGLKNIKPVINSLIDQTVKINMICIIVPYGDNYILPDNLKNSVLLYRTGKNYGLGNCIIPNVIREGENNTKIITVGDNTIYGKDFIEILLDKSDKNPNSVIYHDNKQNGFNLEKGVVFNINQFDEDFVKMPENSDSNMWIYNYLDKKDINFIKVKI